MQSVKKIIAVLNDFAMVDAVLEKTLYFAQRHHAFVEVLYVHERPLFEIPDFFRSGKEELPLDKEKIKASILEKTNSFGFEKRPVVFVKIDDTADRVWALAREDKETFVVAGYHKDTTQKLVSKTAQPILVVKGKSDRYRKIALVLNAGTPSFECIENAQNCFPESNIELFYDYRYIVDPTMEAGLQNVQIIEEAQRDAFEELKAQSGLEGKFFIDGDFLGMQMSKYLQEKDFDMLYVCSHADDYFVSDDLSIALLEDAACDILVANK